MIITLLSPLYCILLSYYHMIITLLSHYIAYYCIIITWLLHVITLI